MPPESVSLFSVEGRVEEMRLVLTGRLKEKMSPICWGFWWYGESPLALWGVWCMGDNCSTPHGDKDSI